MKNDHTHNAHNDERQDERQQQAADLERQATDLAWSRMQKLLMNEAPHPDWAKWDAEAQSLRQHHPEAAFTSDNDRNTQQSFEQPIDPVASIAERSAIPTALSNTNDTNHDLQTKGMNTMTPSPMNDNATEQASEQQTIRRKASNTKRRKWATGIAACVVAGTVLATPFGNQALASLLNQFRMQDLATVDRQGLNDMENRYDQNGINDETINRFGTFSSEGGKLEGSYTAEKATKLLGYTFLPAVKMAAGEKAIIFPAYIEHFRLNTDAVNEAIKRLGGTTLMPEEANQKMITLTMPETINYSLINDDEKWAQLSQQRMPQLTLDPSMNAEKVFAALRDLPLLPDDVRAILQKDQLLKGQLALPIISDQPIERIDVNGMSVLLEQRTYKEHSHSTYTAYWTVGDEMYQLDGNNEAFPDKAAVIAKIKELMNI
ncbi:hypothetical protein [Paenibacillus campi]|uniref:hypothetical protein n=1 Tax=Paenibacillus campi TaxID=3106031 RepID=UPI002AFF1389|nr:hypothetical protein [Paenibacillus sp. SGZ-1014]